jgi:hypothetical protein
MIALTKILAEDPHFLAKKSLNAWLVDVNITDVLQVQCASVRCNKLSHTQIADTFGDKLGQFYDVLLVYCQATKIKFENINNKPR